MDLNKHQRESVSDVHFDYFVQLRLHNYFIFILFILYIKVFTTTFYYVCLAPQQLIILLLLHRPTKCTTSVFLYCVLLIQSEWMLIQSEWMLFNANSAMFQLYHGENKSIFDEMMIRSALY